MTSPPPPRVPRTFTTLLYLTVFVISACGLAYQLLAGAVAGYLFGEGVTQFAIVTGVFLSALGVGAAVSQRITQGPGRVFVEVGLAAGLVGGSACELLFLAYARSRFFHPVLYGVLLADGVLVGVELPLLLRLMRRYVPTRELLARALTADYAGAVVGSLALSLVVLPRLGVVRTGIVFGMLQVIGVMGATRALGPAVGPHRPLYVRGALALSALTVLLVLAGRFASVAEDGMYPDPVMLSLHTRYQRIAITAGHGSMNLFLDGNLQFASMDEHRYHEALVHPAFGAARSHARVLVLGGGDGLATREILRYPDVQDVTLVDLDPAMTDLARHFAPLVQLNEGSLLQSRVHVVNADAMVWLTEGTDRRFDVAIVDFPDPNNFSLGKLYTTRFYALLRRRLAPGAVVVVQSTSPWMARQSFWCVVATLEAGGYATLPYHAAVPSFGEWGYVLAAPDGPVPMPAHVPPGLRYLDDAVLPTLFVFGPDMRRVPVEVNRLNNQVLVQYYEHEWRRFGN